MSPNFQPGDRLIDTPHQPLGQRVPEPLHERVEQLCDAAYAAGEARRPTKMQMVAALIFGGPTDPSELRDLLDRYARAKVVDAMVQTAIPDGSVIEFPVRKSGPRSPGRASATVHDSQRGT